MRRDGSEFIHEQRTQVEQASLNSTALEKLVFEWLHMHTDITAKEVSLESYVSLDCTVVDTRHSKVLFLNTSNFCFSQAKANKFKFNKGK